MAAEPRTAPLNPTAEVARHGDVVPRGLDPVSGPPPMRGRFGRMFPTLDACDPGDDALRALFDWLAEPHEDPGDNRHFPAGFSYFGQFVDHDITFDPMSRLDKHNDPSALVNFRSPRFDLDSVYGSGPRDQPFLYDWDHVPVPGVKLLVGSNPPRADFAGVDLPRNQQGRALTGDARNDENLIVAQLHLLLIHYHNAVVEQLAGAGRVADDDLFGAAQKIVRWHYQWIVVHEFLSKVVGRQLANDVLEQDPPAGRAPAIDRRYFTWPRQPFIPVEFSGAAYRFGHSAVRDSYAINSVVQRAAIFPMAGERHHLMGFRRLPADLVIDWQLFFALGPARPQFARRMDPVISPPLFHLPGDVALPWLNLQRGVALGLPSGQDVAREMHAEVLCDEEILPAGSVRAKKRDTLLRGTPLWYYILCEAATKIPHDGSEAGPTGRHLGPVGGRIVAEVLVGLLEADPTSYLHLDPTWRPHELLSESDDYTMADLVRFARPDG